MLKTECQSCISQNKDMLKVGQSLDAQAPGGRINRLHFVELLQVITMKVAQSIASNVYLPSIDSKALMEMD